MQWNAAFCETGFYSWLMTPFHLLQQKMSFYCSSTRCNSLLLIAILMTSIPSCKTTMRSCNIINFCNYISHSLYSTLWCFDTSSSSLEKTFWPSTSNISVVCAPSDRRSGYFRRRRESLEKTLKYCVKEERGKQWLSFNSEGAPKTHLVNH